MTDMDPEKHADGFTPSWGYVVAFDKYAAQAARIEQLEAAMADALERLDASLFENSEHAQAKSVIREALISKEPKP